MIIKNKGLNHIKLLTIICIFVFLMSGCTPKSDKCITLNSELNGYNLEDINLTIELDKLKIFADSNKNNNYTPSYYLYNVKKGLTEWKFNDIDMQKYGNLTVLGYNYSDNTIDMTFIPILYIQGFKKVNNNDKELIFIINENKYTKEQIKEFILYEDTEVIVLDITELIPIEEFSSVINKLQENADFQYNYKWLIDVYDYLKVHKDIVIKPLQ